jgi:LuxR family transcriptional regulator, maltose regulon positive regulatory protein
MLQDLEEANAFVVSLDAARSWFRYHRLFADLLQLELRRTGPGEVAALHDTVAGWLAERGFGVEAIRHAQAAQDWGRAARLLADHWPGLHLDAQAATVHALLAGFPAEACAADVELAAVAAADELARGSLEAAERYLGLAERGSASVPAGRRGQLQMLLWIVRLLLARQSGNLLAVTEKAQRLQALAEAQDAAQPSLGEELRAGTRQPRHRRGRGGPVRPGRAAPGAGRDAGAPDRAAVSRVHRPGVPGDRRVLPVVSEGGGAQHAGGRAGPGARLD